MRYGLTLLAIMAVGVLSGPGRATDSPMVMVELFTSQGCSSCPPADQFMAELAQREDVLALSFHVDYWDYIGWKDPFASARHSMRQREYKKAFGLRSVYTPQIVVQGRFENVGSDKKKTLANIEKAQALPHVGVSLQRDKDGYVVISLPEVATNPSSRLDAEVLLVTYDRQHQTNIKRGENQGLNLTNFNVVRALQKLTDWHGEARQIRSLPKRWTQSGDACAVIVQERMGGAILGVAVVALDAAR